MTAHAPNDSQWTARSELKDAQLARIRLLATSLLATAGVIYVISFVFGAVHPALKYVAAFSEAAMVGALADWFAVVALFRHPMGLKLPHTAIVPNNKARIAAGLSQFIQQNFLSSQAIVAKIAEVGPADTLRRWLLNEQNAEKVASFATRLLSYLLTALDDARVRDFLQGVAISKLKQLDLASTAGQLLDVLTENQRHHAVLNEVLRLLDEALSKPDTQDYIAKAVLAESKLVEAMKKMGWDLDEVIAGKIVGGVARTIEAMRSDKDHELRTRFDAFIFRYVDKLKHDDATRAKVRKLQDELVSNPGLASYVDTLWQELRAWLSADLADRGSKVHQSVVRMVAMFGREIDASREIREWIDEQILESLPALVDEHKAKIGRFIEDTVNSWQAEQFVKAMEREIGPDLQFIRINGTLVGGLAGLAIYSASQLLV